jgi:hypothetical protein
LTSLNNYLKENNLKTVDFTDDNLNFEFIQNKYNIKDYKNFIDYLFNNYFKQIGVDKKFIEVLLEVFQDSVVVDYYN